MSKAMGFQCPKKGHSPMEGIPEETLILNGYPHVGRVCRYCKCAYFELVSSERMIDSGLLDPKGAKIIVKEDGN